MQKSIISALAIILLTISTYAQDKSKQVELSLNGSFFMIYEDPGWGIGVSGKMLVPVGDRNNCITLGLGVDRMKEINYKVFLNEEPPVYTMINASVGYRKRYYVLFVEPVVGIGLFHDKHILNERYQRDRIYTYLNFYGGLGAGIERRNFTYGIDFRINYVDPFKDDVYFIFGLKAGYRFGKR
jgi:hypothetical protein